MNLPRMLKGTGGAWNVAILGTLATALIVNAIGLLSGITIVLPHLLYIPVVIAAYRHPKNGLLFAGCTAGIYFLMVLLIPGSSPVTVGEALVRAVVITVIGGLIAALTLLLREQQALYRGLFDHSEAGSILVHDSGEGRSIEEVSEKAAALLQKSPSDLKRGPLTAFWSGEEEEEAFSRLAEEGKVYAWETSFSLPGGGLLYVLVSLASLPGGRTILTFVDITGRVRAENALKTAMDKLNLLGHISSDYLHRTVNEIIETVDDADEECHDEVICGYFERIRSLSWTIARQLFHTESYKDLGTFPPIWISTQQVLESAHFPGGTEGVSLRFWTERLEVYADPLIRDALIHIVENSLRHGESVRNIVVTYHETTDGPDLLVEDDGVGIPEGDKDQIFEYGAEGHTGIGLFICRQILEVTGMTIEETGMEGTGARFVIHIPHDAFRIEGSGEGAPARSPDSGSGVPHPSGASVRELLAAEFSIAEALWIDYHQTKGDARIDRIFAAFVDGKAVSLARCRRHPDGFEVDAVFTPDDYRGHGYANAAVWALVEACGHETLYMHSVSNLTRFYGHYGFIPIEEGKLPPTIRERYAWAGGEMEGANVCPMMRLSTPS